MIHRSFLRVVWTEFLRSIRLSLPLGAMELVYGISFFLSTAMIAHLGKEAMVTNVLVWGIFIALMLFSFGTFGAISVMASQSCGVGKLEDVGRVFRQGLLLSILCSIPTMLLMWIVPEVLTYFKLDQEIIALATPYFHAFTWTVLPYNMCVMVEQYLIGIGASKTALLTSVLCVPVEIVLIYALIFGKFNCPAYGLLGVPYALALSMTLTLLILLLYLYFAPTSRAYSLFRLPFTIDKQYLLELIRIGAPLGGMFCIESALFATLTMMMATLGRDTAAGHQIAMQCFSFAMNFAWGASQAATVRVGYEVGRGNKHGVKIAAYVNIFAGTIIMSCISLLYILKPDTLIRLDVSLTHSDFTDVVRNARSFIFVMALVLIADCFRIISFAVLRGIKDTKCAMYISFVTFWMIVLPLAYTFCFKFALGGIGIWLGLLCGMVIGSILALWRFRTIVSRIDLKKMITQ